VLLRRTVLAALVLAAAGLLATRTAHVDDRLPAVVASPVPLLADDPKRTRVGRLELLAGFALSSPHPDFGGLSALLIEPGGELVAVSDRDTFWRARLVDDPSGRLTELADWRTGALGSTGPETGGLFDGEDLARLDGALAVVAETRGVLHLYPHGDLAAPARVADLPAPVRNEGPGGIETLTELGDGRLMMIAEELLDPDGVNYAWLRGPAGDYEELGYRAAPGFSPTGADRLGDTLYVLERAFGLPFGFAARIVRLPVDAVVPGARLEGEELARLDSPLTRDNFEGIAARPGPDGRVQLFILSDDNFLPLQRTLLMQFAIDD
jgi:hypothetical protein